jgi:glycosyltransferase involved in cell wall biosynthesis
MRIAQVAPLYEAVPPLLYGGTERVVAHLTEELIDLGHEVTLFASGDSRSRASLVSPCRQALRLDAACQDRQLYHVLQLEQVMARWRDFDLIHFHTDYSHYPAVRRCPVPTVTTLHGRQDLPDLQALYREYADVPLISISDAQRAPLPWVNWRGTVHHGLPLDLYLPGSGQGGYLAFLGRISPEKRCDRAVEIATRAGLPLKIAAKVDSADREYYKTVRHLFDHPLVEFIGEIGEDRKSEFLGAARALLFPIDWPEPFGLVMIEAMACGTPVLAFRSGSVPEVIDDGVTGAVVGSVDEAVAELDRVLALDRAGCRRRFEERFSARRMAEDYLALYRSLTRFGRSPLRPALSTAA